jgi:D-psicose/D-tagatose/L-ribulose 3-epimerase
MRFGISNLIFPKLSDTVLGQVLSTVDSCDFAPTGLYGAWDNVPNVLPRYPYEPYRVPIAALQSLMFGCPGASLVRSTDEFTVLTRHFEYVAHLASRSGVEVLVFGSPATRNGIDPGLGEVELRSRVRQLADIAARHRTKLCFEVNSPRFGCEFLNVNSALRHLLNDLQHPGLGLHLDCGQMIEEGVDPLDYISTAAPELTHLHLSAPDFGCPTKLLPLFREIVRTLKRSGYQSDVVLEVQKLAPAEHVDLVQLCKALSSEIHS